MMTNSQLMISSLRKEAILLPREVPFFATYVSEKYIGRKDV